MNTKYILPILAFGALATACSDEPSVSPQTDDATYINFGVPTATVETRAPEALPEGVHQGSTLLNGIQSGTSFGVMGYCRAYQPGSTEIQPSSAVATWAAKKQNAFPEIFYQQEVTYDGSICRYTYGDTGMPRKWLTDADGGGEDAGLFKYTFFSYYPKNSFKVTSPENAQAKGAPVLEFSMPFSSTDESTPLDQSQVPDVMLDALYNTSKGGKVSFDFTHALTALSFTVNNYNENMPLTVYKITLSGEFWKTMTVDMNETPAVADFKDTYKGTYTIYDNANGMGIQASIGGTSVTPPAFADQYILLISGKIDNATGMSYIGHGETLKVTIDYEFGENGVRKTASFTRPATFVPRPGTMYQAQLNFVGDAFVLQFVNANSDLWEDGSDTDITFE